jgi:hypothetical protein
MVDLLLVVVMAGRVWLVLGGRTSTGSEEPGRQDQLPAGPFPGAGHGPAVDEVGELSVSAVVEVETRDIPGGPVVGDAGHHNSVIGGAVPGGEATVVPQGASVRPDDHSAAVLNSSSEALLGTAVLGPGRDAVVREDPHPIVGEGAAGVRRIGLDRTQAVRDGVVDHVVLGDVSAELLDYVLAGDQSAGLLEAAVVHALLVAPLGETVDVTADHDLPAVGQGVQPLRDLHSRVRDEVAVLRRTRLPLRRDQTVPRNRGTTAPRGPTCSPRSARSCGAGSIGRVAVSRT